MPKFSAKKRDRAKGSASGDFFRRWKWVWFPGVVLVLIRAMQVAGIREGSELSIRHSRWRRPRLHRRRSRNSLSMIDGGTMPEAQMAAKVCWRLNGLPRKELGSTRLSPDASAW